MIRLKSIKIDQAEGRVDRLVSREVRSFSQARSALWQVAHQCKPEMLGYLKTDVVIEWEDGSTHKLRADVKGDGSDCDPGTMLRRWAEFMLHGGPSWMEEAKRRKRFESNRRLYGERFGAACDHAERILNKELEVL